MKRREREVVRNPRCGFGVRFFGVTRSILCRDEAVEINTD